MATPSAAVVFTLVSYNFSRLADGRRLIDLSAQRVSNLLKID